jgi:uncharacterized protein (TIGR00255 family)
MLRSMTGFGSGRAVDGERSFLVELRSVNHKFCDVRTRLPRELSLLEGRVQSFVRERVARGRVDVSIEIAYSSSTVHRPRVNVPLARGYKEALEQLSSELGLNSTVSLAQVASSPGVIEAPEIATDPEETLRVVEAAMNSALGSLNTMRDREGASLKLELSRLLDEVTERLDAVTREVPYSNQNRRVRLEQRMKEYLGEVPLDPARLVQELALLVDRADVTEEIARLGSHVDQFRRLLESTEPVGRKLDFLLQEMHREANTIGSKSSNARISHMVVDLKSAVERMREQAQNVE